MGDGPNHFDAERDAREASAARISDHRDRLLAFARLVDGVLKRTGKAGITITDEDTLRREIEGLI